MEQQVSEASHREDDASLQFIEDAELAGIGKRALHHFQSDAEGGDGLNGVVVDVRGDPATFLLLGPREIGEEAAAFLVGLLELIHAPTQVFLRPLGLGLTFLERGGHIVEGPAELAELVPPVGEAAPGSEVPRRQAAGGLDERLDLPEHEQFGSQGCGRRDEQGDQGQLEHVLGERAPNASEQHQTESGENGEQYEGDQARPKGREARYRGEMLQALHQHGSLSW